MKPSKACMLVGSRLGKKSHCQGVGDSSPAKEGRDSSRAEQLSQLRGWFKLELICLLCAKLSLRRQRQ